MVAEEVPRVFCRRNDRVGVKRPREQARRLAASAAPVRPALDADPTRPVHQPTMTREGTGPPSPATDSRRPTRLPERPRSLLIAATPADDDRRLPDPPTTGPGVTHGLLGLAVGPVTGRLSPFFHSPQGHVGHVARPRAQPNKSTHPIDRPHAHIH